MRAFLTALCTLLLLTGGIVRYSAAVGDFAKELYEGLSVLPDTEAACEKAGQEELNRRCKMLCERFEKQEWLLHLGIPYEREERVRETLLRLREAARAEEYALFCAERALCLKELELLQGYETLSFENLV